MAEETLVAPKTGNLILTREEKGERYRHVMEQARAVLQGETDLLAGMATLVCLLHNAFPYFYWTGFYRRVGPEMLLVGPYQGTLGCLHIPFGQGVCGACARERRTIVVADVHTFPGHIACDAASASEIVVPVLDATGELLAVLDVDSTEPAAFDDADTAGLEELVSLLVPLVPRPLIS